MSQRGLRTGTDGLFMSPPPAVPTADAPQGSKNTTLYFALLYAGVSSTLSLANKWALVRFPYAGLLTAFQFGFSVLVVWGLAQLGVLALEPLEWDKIKRMAPVTCVFYLAIYTNTKILQFATLEVFIAFRSATPIMVCVIDTLVRGQPKPSGKTTLALLGILLGAVGFGLNDTRFSAEGYGWACAYLLIITFEMVYAKHITKTIGALRAAPDACWEWASGRMLRSAQDAACHGADKCLPPRAPAPTVLCATRLPSPPWQQRWYALRAAERGGQLRRRRDVLMRRRGAARRGTASLRWTGAIGQGLARGAWFCTRMQSRS